MVKIISSVENVRRDERMRQDELARLLGISQGHYSKVLAGKVPLSGKLENRISSWLDEQGRENKSDAKSHRIRELTNSIRAQCMELIQLANSD